MFCPSCGTKNEDYAKFCEVCGVEIVNNQPTQQTASFDPAQESDNNQLPEAKEDVGKSPSMRKNLSKTAKMSVAAVLAIVIVAVAFFAIGSEVANHRDAAKGEAEYPVSSPDLSNREGAVDYQSYDTHSDFMYRETPPIDSFQEESVTPLDALPPENLDALPPFEQTDEPSAQDAPHSSQRVLIKNSGNGWILEFEEWDSGGWTTRFQAPAYVGRNGTSADTLEGDRKSPAGTYNILFCFGIAQPNTNLRFKRINSGDIFVDAVDSPYYNTIVDASQVSAGTSHEKVYNQFANGSYTTKIFFDFNGDGETPNTSTSGRGSVRTLRGRTGALRDTLGDIDISSSDMATLLSYLDSSKQPIIIIE